MRCAILVGGDFEEESYTEFVEIPDKANTDEVIKVINQALAFDEVPGEVVAWCKDITELKHENYAIHIRSLPNFLYFSSLPEEEAEKLYVKYGKPTTPKYAEDKKEG